MKVRIKFTKHGDLKFIGHLDMMRFFQKAFRRAGFDLLYSKGYHPHPIMSFASPLGLGLESEGEYMDIELESCPSTELLKAAANENMAEGVTVSSIRLLRDDAKNSMSVFAAADYLVRFRDYDSEGRKSELSEKLCSSCIESFLNKDEINVLKKTKKNETVIDIRPLIYEMRREEDALFLKLSAGSASNLKPELVIKTICEMNDICYDPYLLLITRLEMYADAGVEERELVPLEEFQTL